MTLLNILDAGCFKHSFCGSIYPGSFLNIRANRPFSVFLTLFLPFLPFSGGPNSTWELQRSDEKALLLRYPWICLKPHLSKPAFGTPVDHKLERPENIGQDLQASDGMATTDALTPGRPIVQQERSANTQSVSAACPVLAVARGVLAMLLGGASASR